MFGTLGRSTDEIFSMLYCRLYSPVTNTEIWNCLSAWAKVALI